MAANYALAYVQLEDYGARVAMGLLRARGEMGRWFGRDSMEGDFGAQREYALAVQNYPRLEQATRDVYEGFAAGVNRYIELHPNEFPAGFKPNFTGYDVAARDVTSASLATARRFLARVAPQTNRAAGRSRRGRSVERGRRAANAGRRSDRGGLERVGVRAEPHEVRARRSCCGIRTSRGAPATTKAHMTVPGVLDFYGDFRIGGPFGVIGGFNKDLGWSTTNNAPDLDEIYALDVDPARADRYLFDGTSLPLERELTTVTYRNGNGALDRNARVVAHAARPRDLARRRQDLRAARGGRRRLPRRRAVPAHDAGEVARRVEGRHAHARRASTRTSRTPIARATSSTSGTRRSRRCRTRAAATPRPCPRGARRRCGRATSTSIRCRRCSTRAAATCITRTTRRITRTCVRCSTARSIRRTFRSRSLRLRSQMALTLIDNTKKLSLEDVIALKHSYRMLLADRVKDDLHCGGARDEPRRGDGERARQLAKWDNAAGPTSKGAVLFESWWQLYTQGSNCRLDVRGALVAREARDDAAGLKDPARAARGVRAGGRGDDASVRRSVHCVGRRASRANGQGGRAGWRLQRRVRLLPRAQLRHAIRMASGP